MDKVQVSRLSLVLFATLAIGLFGNQASAGDYKGALSSDTLVFDVTYMAGGTVQTETWFAQWHGNVYSKVIEAEVPKVGDRFSSRRFCENASWVAPERHIWKEGDEPYLTRSQDMKLIRLEHSLKRVDCRKMSNETRGVSKRALKNARRWLQSRSLQSSALDRNRIEVANVETWIRENLPGVVSVKLTDRKREVLVAGRS